MFSADSVGDDGVGDYGVGDCVQSPRLLALITSLSALMLQVWMEGMVLVLMVLVMMVLLTAYKAPQLLALITSLSALMLNVCFVVLLWFHW